MRLKSIKLAGFKSFVDPTTAHFPTNLSAVVGPNGCGKSNIIDAVRWVMGESSAKNLRGESMTDVIFNGSVNRKPVGQASIELIFDNTSGQLGGEYARFSEIAIRRKVTREGLSEYYLNGTKCRRRDITDIFLGTGLGPRSYAIIEQGMISRLIESKPEELRVFIEEAAGISKYKERRRETENRMRRTQENLERLTDLRDELERQLQHLQRQAAAAEKYTEYKKEERLLKAQLQVLQWQALDEQVQDKDRKIRELELGREAIVTEQVSLNTGIEQARDQHSQLNDAFNEVQGRFYSVGADIARSEQAIQHQQERHRQLQADLQRLDTNLIETRRHLETDREKIALWEEEIEAIAPELEITLEQEEQSSEALILAEESMQTWQQRWDEFNQRAAGPRQRAEVEQSRIQHLELTMKRLQERLQKAESERGGLLGEQGDDDIELLQQQAAELDLQGESLQEQLDQLQPQIAEQREGIRSDSDALDSARSQLQSLRGRMASLEALQQAALGQGDKAVSEWLSAKDLANLPRVGESLQVADKWQKAVETVLGDQLQALSLDSIDSLAPILAELETGALTFLESASASAGKAGTLAEVVTGHAALSASLSSVYLAEDLTEALQRRNTLQDHESLVTPEGLLIGKHSLRVNRGDNAQSGVLARQEEIQELQAQVEELQQQVAELQQRLEAGREQQKRLEEQRDGVQRELQQHGRQQAELRSQLSAQQARIEQISARRQGLDAEIGELAKQYKAEQETLAEARMSLSEAIESMEQDSGQREQLLGERDRNRTVLDEARQKARHSKDHAHQLAMRHQSLQTQRDSVMAGIGRTEEQLAQLMEQQETLQLNLGEVDGPVEELKMELEAKLEQRLAVEEELAEARRSLEAVDHQLREHEQKRHGVEQRLQQIAGQLEQARVENQGLQVRRKGLLDQLQEAQFDLNSVLESLPEGASESDWQQQLEAVGRRIDRLGPINLAAIEEYKQQSERKNYLDSQNQDLVDALETLESAIRRIDKETRNRFKETFDQVNSGLQNLFPKVFGGGSAYLEMTGDDLLNTGISIMARPPGKRNATIHLLSGGEKALTAIALVFSIFRLNPAPFCMLDEVDAPLDDANVGRYSRMVKEMSSEVQFIYISHNKIAMEMADQLMGVTMHEPGVSRLVSVDIEKAAELAAS
ncbi:chromosome segregation protein SMC [Spongiibacter sp. KMU-158]|uniref:Chromosome partition protein Smc n=1 Tax=Spongiibacter pelagi TaxID=2760804 RepID=A0A927C3A2_9GAMM|nr:chromosome segregation protein SMC [Spongiibacter pelagi]MBD2859032.1 chromosome segregation protein SMC [Spongiibacter pelagi]